MKTTTIKIMTAMLLVIRLSGVDAAAAASMSKCVASQFPDGGRPKTRNCTHDKGPPETCSGTCYKYEASPANQDTEECKICIDTYFPLSSCDQSPTEITITTTQYSGECTAAFPYTCNCSNLSPTGAPGQETCYTASGSGCLTDGGNWGP
jgi:hypothetical protein